MQVKVKVQELKEVKLIDGLSHQERDISGSSIIDLSEKINKATALQKILLDYFVEKTNGSRLARREDLIPSEIIKLLPNISLFDLFYGKNGEIIDMHFRLLGTALVKFYGEWTGKHLNQGPEEEKLVNVFPATYHRVISLAEACVLNKAPVSIHSERVSEDLPHLQLNSMFIPMSDDGKLINILCGFTEISTAKS